MGLRLITGPATEPITTSEAMAHCRVTEPTEAPMLDGLIRVARQDLDGREGRLMGVALITQTWELLLDEFPPYEIQLPLRPLQAIDSIKYDDVNGAEQTVPSSDYIADTASRVARVVPAPSKSWPGTRSAINAVRVRFTVGYGAPSAIPEVYRQAMKLLVGHLYAHRGDAVASAQVPETYFTLLGVR